MRRAEAIACEDLRAISLAKAVLASTDVINQLTVMRARRVDLAIATNIATVAVALAILAQAVSRAVVSAITL